MPESKFFFVSAVPLLHSGLVRERAAYFKEKNEVRKRLKGIPFFTLPIYAPQNFVFSSRHSFRTMHIGASWHLARLLRRIDPDVVHCRSYHATYAALQLRERLGKKYKVIFDARGVWSAEVALKRNFPEEGKNYKFLLNLEKWIVEKSDATISVSPQMGRYFENLGCNRSACIYLSAPVDKFEKLSSSAPKEKEPQAIALVYLGTLGVDTWHKPSELVALYKHLVALVGRVRLKIITMSNHGALLKQLEALGLCDVEIVSTKSIEELAAELGGMDIGVLSYFKPKTKNERLLSSVVMAVKTAEYLAAGLPILVNKYCGGAAEVVSTNSVGIAYNPDTFEEITEHALNSLRTGGAQQRSVFIAKDLFDRSANAQRYAKTYRQVVS
ncbi:glycosyltransferase [Variovorax paradoxus]